VYAYASEHLPAWSEELGEELGPAAFGENLTTAGGTEDDVCIGDRWYWGDAVLEVCQPRTPCFKLAMHRGRGDIGRRFRETGRSGWYLRVLEPGRVPVAGPITVDPHPMGATVSVVNEARLGRAPLEVVEALLHVEPLADNWKMALVQRLPG
jgi:MOSC domain-containing protein YiiM